jgi:carbonic anhydrase
VLGNITPMLENIKPAVDAVSGHEGNRSSSNAAFVQEVAEKNVRLTVEDIRKRSPVLREQEEAGEIKIVGALYDMDTGEIEFLD